MAGLFFGNAVVQKPATGQTKLCESEQGVTMSNVYKILALSSVCLAVAGCQVNKTQSGKLPKVEMKTSEGQLPAYNIQGPDVQVGSKTKSFNVPTVHVTTPRERNQANQNSN
jgi:hypothetical protein